MKEFRPVMQLKKADLSIQASETHYSSPKTHLEDIQDYDKVEIAMFHKNKGGWVNPHAEEFMKDFKRLNELLEVYEDGAIPVGGYVPIDLMNDLIKYLSE